MANLRCAISGKLRANKEGEAGRNDIGEQQQIEHHHLADRDPRP